MEKLLGQFPSKKLKYDRIVCVMLFFLAILSLLAPYESHAGQWIPIESGTDEYLFGVWGSSASDVFVVGLNETILHYDGNQWSEINTGYSASFYAVWGSSANDVFVVGNLGTILHYDGNQWTQMSTPPAVNPPFLRDIWGFSGSDVFVVGTGQDIGEGGTVLHYDGNQWTEVYQWTEGDPGSYHRFNSVWGRSANDLFIGGTEEPVMTYFIAHYNGVSVSTMLTGDNIPANGFWGSSGSDIFAVGANASLQGVIYHYNGISWSEMSQSPTPNYLMSVWGRSGSDVYAVGDSGTILHYDGNQWTQMNSGISERLNDVWGFPGGEVFAVGDGGTILRYTEYTVKAMPCVPLLLIGD